MALKDNIIDSNKYSDTKRYDPIATPGLQNTGKTDEYFQEFNRLVPEKYVIKRHPGQYWGGSNSRLVPDIITRAHRVLYDEQRLAMWTLTPEGINWNAKQIGLQLMNPMVETGGKHTFLNIPPTRVFNPIALFLNTASSVTLLRFARHGINPFDTFTYEGASKLIKSNESFDISGKNV